MTNDARIGWIIMTCKGICTRHKAPVVSNGNRYSVGHKRCQVCEIFIHWDGFWCPCCNSRLRMRPRDIHYREKLKTRKEDSEYQLSLQQHKG